jgi:ABC-type lipoprotein release transport system permease subunit
MAKDKTNRKAAKKKKEIQKKQAFEQQKAVLKTAEVLKHTLLKRIRPATKNYTSLASRFIWNGASLCDIS